MSIRVVLFVAGISLAAGCAERAPRAEPPEVRFERVAAYRQACASRLIAERATDDLDMLAAAFENIQTGVTPELGRQTANAALTFGRAFQGHAELRAMAYAHLDSAVNHSPSRPDSIRHINAATSYSIRMPAEGSLEANVLTRYQGELTALIGDADHPCNWDIPF